MLFLYFCRTVGWWIITYKMLQNKINIVQHSILVRPMLWHDCVGKDPCLHQDKHKKTEMVKWRTTWFYTYNNCLEMLAELRSDSAESGSCMNWLSHQKRYQAHRLTMICTVEPWFNEGPRDWQNLFVITRFCYIKVLFHIFYHYWGKKNCSLHWGLRYLEVC